MNDDSILSVYELGIISNSLRERMMTIEEFRTNLVAEDEQEVMNKRVDIFRLELVEIQEKIRKIISNRADEYSL